MRLPFILLCLVVSVLNSAVAAEIVVTGEECSNIVAHQPDSNVAYKPGVDVDGAAVAPADVEPQQLNLPQTITIPLDIELQNGKAVPKPSDKIGKLKMDGQLGSLKLNTASGQLYYGDQLLSDANQHAVIEACKKQKK